MTRWTPMSPLPRTPRPELPHVKHEECWAKTTADGQPGISVAQHCRTAGIVADLLVQRIPAWLTKSLSASVGVVLAALHDVGKISPGFLWKCPAWVSLHGLDIALGVGQEASHAKVSQKTVQDRLSDGGLDLWAGIVG